MQRTSSVFTLISITSITLLACGGGGGMSNGSGGTAGGERNGSGGVTGDGGSGSGTTTTTTVDPSVGGAVGTIPTGVGGAGIPTGVGGTSIPTGVGGASIPTGAGGASIPTGAGGATIPTGAGGISTAGVGGTIGTTVPVGCDQDLSGTWDLFASSVGSGIVQGTLVVSKDGFSLTTTASQLAYNGQGTKTATWKHTDYYYGTTTRLITVQNTPAAANAGSVLIALGGHWVLQSGSETCTLDVATDKITSSCSGRPTDHNVGGSDWPWILPSPENGLHYTIARGSAQVSQFGDFGGSWTARSDSPGSTQGCSINLAGNGATTSCRANNSFNGAMHLTVGADCVGSGVTPTGQEVSARRR